VKVVHNRIEIRNDVNIRIAFPNYNVKKSLAIRLACLAINYCVRKEKIRDGERKLIVLSHYIIHELNVT